MNDRQMKRQQDWRVVKITEVNTAVGHISGEDQYGTPLMLDVTNKGLMFQIPQVGEMWTVRRRGSDWLLDTKYDNPDVEVPVEAMMAGDARIEAPGGIYIVGANGVTLGPPPSQLLISATVEMPFESQQITGYTSYSPTWTGAGGNPVIGNGFLNGKYFVSGKYVHAHIEITMGSTTTYGLGGWILSLPLTMAASTNSFTGTGLAFDSSATARYSIAAYKLSTTTIGLLTLASPGAVLLATVPFTWAQSDVLSVDYFYEAA